MHDFEGPLSWLFGHDLIVNVGYACCLFWRGRLTLIVDTGNTCIDFRWMDLCGLFIVSEVLVSQSKSL